MTEKSKKGGPAPTNSHSPAHCRVLELALNVSKDAGISELAEIAEEILSEIRMATLPDMSLVYKAIDVLREQPNFVKLLIARYESLPETRYDERLLMIQLIGEFRTKMGFEYLKAVVWKEPPPSIEVADGLSIRDHEEIIQSKAVHGLAYMRNEEGFKETLTVMCNHKALPVRIAAINAYMWNHNDNDQAAKQLYDSLPTDLHKYVGRPRFHRDMNPRDFNRKHADWIRKWGEGKANQAKIKC
jgi:hypothetical protein